MSRIGKKPVAIPAGVEVKMENGTSSLLRVLRANLHSRLMKS